MTPFKLVHANSLQEAIKIGAETLGVEKNQIWYRVINRRKSFFGKETLTVFVSVMKEQKEDKKRRKIVLKNLSFKRTSKKLYIPSSSDRSGMAWIRNGQVYCQNGKSHFPALHPCEGVEILLNGVVVKNEVTIITEDDTVELRTIQEEVKGRFSLEPSPDKMEVYVQVQPGYTITKKVCNALPSRLVKIEVKEEKFFKPLDEDEIYQELAAQFHAQAIPEQIQQACASTEPKAFVIARGKPVIPGRDGYFAPVRDFQYDTEKQNDEKDFVNHLTVREGDIIGYVKPPVPGQNGYDVFGDIIETSEPNPLQVYTRDGVLYLIEKGIVVAKRSGRVLIKSYSPNNMVFQVVPVYLYEGNVNSSMGSILFDGDVSIKGNVEENTLIKASGCIYITGSVTNSKILAGEDIIIKGAAHSASITSGWVPEWLNESLPIGKETHEMMGHKISAIKQLTSNPAFLKSDLAKKGFQPLLKLLLEMKFNEFPSLVQKLKLKITPFANKEWNNIITILDQTFLQQHMLSSIEQLQEIAYKLKNCLDEMEQELFKSTLIFVERTDQCELDSTGHIVIKDRIFQSTIRSKISVQAGMIEASDITAGEKITAVQAGSSTDTKTVLNIEKGEGVIVAEHIWKNTTIKVGGNVEKLHQSVKRAFVHRDVESENITIERNRMG
ncbi:FapA family protein [Neobacillus sp. 114]|uniref:FapA family protein n=1 Tax=Neobacillus sp. 114 TaxID=3048535 RepID=UPI0024C2917D|nr:FapA family protein [Neobacillus sp. 114]